MEEQKPKFLDEGVFFLRTKFRDLMLGTDDFGLVDLALSQHKDSYFDEIDLLTKCYDDWLYSILVEIEKPQNFDNDILSEIQKNAETDKNRPKAEYTKIISKLTNDKRLTIAEVFSLSWIWRGDTYRAIRFTPTDYKLTNEQKSEIQKKTSEYLNLFENDALRVDKRNYYRFEMQKKVFIERIENQNMIAKHGNNFILSESVNSSNLSKKDPNFLLLQTAYAMQDIGYLTVHNAWRDGASNSLYADMLGNGDYVLHVNIEINDNLLALLKQEYQKQNPKNLVERYDASKGILKFAGQEIQLGKKGKETDAMRLMETLAKIDPDEWIERGEVYMEWGLTKDDQDQMAKNKVYYAKQTINEAVARKTKIEDFIEGATLKWRINPLYQKRVDE